MKYSVSIRQPKNILAKADEFYANYADISYVYEIAEEFANKTCVIIIPQDTEIDWNLLIGLQTKFKYFICGIADLYNYSSFKKHKIPFFYSRTINDWCELRQIIKLGVSQILIGGPLFFDLIEINKCNIPVRVVANKSFFYDIPAPASGAKGTYIRPEDIPQYEPYVSTILFYSTSLSQEATLLKIYKEDQTWPGNLNLLINGFNENLDNRTIPSQFAQARLQCRQSCMRNNSCRLCDRMVAVGNGLMKEIRENKKTKG